MHIKCPHCKKKVDLDAVGKDVRLARIQDVSKSLGVAASLVSEYADCFRLPNQAMTDKKKLRLLNEVKTLLDTGEFSLDRRQYKIARITVMDGIRDVVNRNLLGLTSHRYLYRVLAGKAGSRKDEGRRVEEGRTPAFMPSPPSGVDKTGETEEDRAAREEVFEKIRNLGENLKMPDTRKEST